MATVPPLDAAWTRDPGNPILSPTETWEETAVSTLARVIPGSPWVAWYIGGWNNEALGRMTSLDGIAWTKDPSNPILGLGAGGFAGAVNSPWITDEIGGYRYLYASSGAGFGLTFVAFRSSDGGVTWTQLAPAIAFPASTNRWGERCVWREGSTWYMLQEARQDGDRWKIYLFISTDGLAWSVLNGGVNLSTLAADPLGSRGGPRFATLDGVLTPRFGGLYHLWIHAVDGVGESPSEIYHATSSDRITWTVDSSPVLAHSGVGFESVRISEFQPVVSGSTAYLYYDGVNDLAETSAIGVALGVPVEAPTAVGWDVYDAADPNGPFLATLDNAYGRQFRAELNGTGSGSFKINRHAPEARADVLKKGNIVKVRIPDLGDDYVFAFILEQGDFTLLSTSEEGAEELTFGGRGVLAYLDRAVMWDEAFTTGLDITDTWTEVWSTSAVSKPSGVAFDAAEPGYVYVSHLTTRKVAKVRQSDRVVVAWSPALWADSTHYLAGISFDPSDSTIMWALEAPWLSGSGDSTRVRKIRRSDWATLANTSLGSAIKHTDIRADASNIWLSRYDGSTTIYKRSKSNPATVVNSYSISYKGVVQTHANGIAINGTKIAYWFGGTADAGTGRALIASTSAPTTITSVQDTAGISAFGGDWTTESGQDFLYAVSFVLGKTWKYQLTVATPHDPLDGIWRLDEATPGGVLWRIMQEAQAAGRPQQPIPDASYVFTATDDSNGDSWNPHDGTLEYDARVGEHLCDPILRLIPYGLTVQMSPALVLGGYNAFGTDRTSSSFGAGKVRFVAGVNIADTLRRRLDERQAASHLIVEGDGNVFVEVTQDDLGYVREGYISTQLKDTAAMTGTGEAELVREREIADSVACAVLWGDDEAAGLYLPGPAGSNGHYWVGDTVRVHTGSGEVDFDEENLAVYAITVEEQENGTWRPIPEFISPFLLDPTAQGSSGGTSSSSSSSGSTTGSTGSTGGTTSTSTTVKVKDSVTAKVVAASTIAGYDHTLIESPSGTAVQGHRWPRLDQLEDVDVAEVEDGQALVFDAATGTWLGGTSFATEAVLPTLGGEETVKLHANLGATPTIDLADGNYHQGTLNANCTLAFAGLTNGVLCRWWVEVDQDGTGGRSLAVPGSVVWVNGTAPTLDTTAGSKTILAFASIDGGVTIFGAAGGGSSLAVKDEGVALATAAASLDFVGSGVTATGTGSAKTITIPGGASALSALSDVALSGLAAAQFLRYSGSAWVNVALIVSDYPFHSEVLCDSAGPILQSNGDVITVVGVPN